jgi:cytochrome bd-type quinol oxidase subunit 2
MDYVAIGLVALGFVLSLVAFILRGLKARTEWNLDWKYYRLLALSVFGSVLAFIGFLLFSHGTPDTVDYSQILTVFSLLASGMIAGYFSFTFEQAADDEQFFPFALSTCFILLFYLVFAAISFYIGKSSRIQSIEGANIIAPVIMGMLLLAISVREFWDYRKA